MTTSDYNNAVKYNVTISQKEHCASIAMRGTVEILSLIKILKQNKTPG